MSLRLSTLLYYDRFWTLKKVYNPSWAGINHNASVQQQQTWLMAPSLWQQEHSLQMHKSATPAWQALAGLWWRGKCSGEKMYSPEFAAHLSSFSSGASPHPISSTLVLSFQFFFLTLFKVEWSFLLLLFPLKVWKRRTHPLERAKFTLGVPGHVS